MQSLRLRPLLQANNQPVGRRVPSAFADKRNID